MFEPTNLKQSDPISVNDLFEIIFKGGMPELYKNKNLKRELYFQSYIDTYISENGYGIYEVDIIQRFTGISLGDFIRNFRIYIGSGTLLWLVLAAAVLAAADKSVYWIVTVPALGNWLTTMIAAPVAFSLRYVYIFALGLPLFLILPFFRRSRSCSETE